MFIKPERMSSSQLKCAFIISLLLFITLTNNLQLVSMSTKLLYNIDSSFNITILNNAKVQEPLHNVNTIPGNSIVQSILNYVSWHRQNRECIQKSSCETKNIKALVWKCPKAPKKCGGVGDRFRGIQFAFLLAVITKRIFFIQWPDDPYPLLEALTPATFDWSFPPNISTDSWSFLPWFSCIRPRPCTEGILPSDENLPLPDESGPDINLLTDDVPFRLKDYGHLFIGSRPRPQTVWNLINNRRSMKTIVGIRPIPKHFDVEKVLLKTIFKPSTHVKHYISRVVPEEVRKIGYIAIHVRTGLDVQEGKSSRFQNLNHDLASTAKLVLSCALITTNGTLKNIFLASDSSQFKSIFYHLAKNSNINVFYSSIDTMHLDYVKLGYYRNMTNGELWTSFINVFVDFFTVSEGKVLITNGSGFSRMAFNFGHAATLVELSKTLKTSGCIARNNL